MWAGTYSTSVLSDRCFDTPASATTLLLHGQARSNKWFGTPASTTVLLLCGQTRSNQCFDTSISTKVLLLRGQERIVLRYSLISASALLLVLRYFYYVGRHV